MKYINFRDMHPMNFPDAEIARFQFLAVPHADGLDINEPSYNKRIQEYLSSLIFEDDIEAIINKPGNDFLKENQYVIPFLYARYNVIPDYRVFEYVKKLALKYQNSIRGIVMDYFCENIDAILNQELPDVPLGVHESSNAHIWIISIILIIALILAIVVNMKGHY